MARKKAVEDQPLITAEQLRSISVEDISKMCYLQYGSYVNNNRAIANVADGLKVSYKRLIYATLQYPKGQDIATHVLIPSLQRWHPHSTVGCEGLNAQLVKSGVFSGHGFFGTVQIDGVDMPHAATRYTKNRLSDLYWDVLGDLYKEVPYIESPQGELEPAYLPLVFPLCLYLKSSVTGLGVAVNCVYPNFSPKSLYQAYINNDPSLLEPNVDLMLDKTKSDLQGLWKNGKGRLIYVYKVSRAKSPDGLTEGVLFETKDGTEIFTPKLSAFDKLVQDGKVFIENLTDTEGNKLFVGRIPGAKGITVEDIETIAKKCCYDSTTYLLNVTNGVSVFRIPLYDWLDYTYKNYINLITQVNEKKIERCKFDIKVQESIPVIGNYILNVNPKATDEEISEKLKLTMDVVSQVMSKPISYLRTNKDTSSRVKTLKDKLKDLQNFNPVEYTENIINKL